MNYLAPSTLAAAVLLIPSLCHANWPAWRGPLGTGVTGEKNLPEKWSATENVKWRVPLPERGNSSPVVWGDRVFVTQAITEGKRRTLMCFNRADGKLLWQSGITWTEAEQTQRDNPYCSATPVTDGERVIVSFGSGGLYCYDFAGNELWHREFGKMSHMFGNGASPMLAGSLCVFNFGPDEKARLIAVDKTSGKDVWVVEPPKVDPAEIAEARARAAERGQGGQGGGRQGGGDGQGGGGRQGGGGNDSNSIGSRLAPQIIAQADKDANKLISEAEFLALADAWYDKLDSAKSGKLSQEQVAEKWYDAVPPLDGGDGGGANRGPSRTTAPAIFAAADADKDGSLTRDELKAAFTKWYATWDNKKAGAIEQTTIAQGVDAALPRQQGAGGGGRGFGGGGRGGFGGGATWSTPILIKAGERDELVMGFPNRLAAYDPKTGSQLWLSKGLGGSIYTTPVWGEGALFAGTSGAGGGPAIAVKPGGSGDVTESQRLWRLERVRGSVGSGVIHGGHLFTIGQDGIAVCSDLKTGATVWEERLRGSGSRGGSWSSMLLAGDKIYLPNQSGDVFVFRAGPTFEVLATNSVGESTNASLAADKGELFLRTDKALWCFAQAK